MQGISSLSKVQTTAFGANAAQPTIRKPMAVRCTKSNGAENALKLGDCWDGTDRAPMYGAGDFGEDLS
jgi:hypothetical protein